MRKLMLTLPILALAGCSTVDSDSAKRTGIGAAVGAAGGAIIGAVTGQPGTGAAVGAGLGAALGAGYDQVTKGDEAKQAAPVPEPRPMFVPR